MVAYRYVILLAIILQFAFVINHKCLASSEPAETAPKPMRAQARLWPRGQSRRPDDTPEGVVDFEELQNSDGSYYVLIQGRITNILPADAMHGFHIHDVANYSNGCDSTGGHYNPSKRDHGDIGKPEEHRHVGDLGNVHSDISGHVNIKIKDSVIRLTGTSIYNIMGKPLVIHADPDDLGLGESASSKVNGNAGKRLMCGTIVRD